MTPIGVVQASHLDVGCEDLDRSRHFYQDLLGLTAATPTRLYDRRGPGVGLALDLRVGTRAPAPGAADLGLNRLGIYVTDLDGCFDRLRAAGITTYGAPHATTVEGNPTMRTVVVEDPDGTLVELVEVGVDQVGFVSVGTSDLARSRAFYEEVLGFAPMFDRAPTRQPGDQLGLDGEIELAGAYYDDPRRAGAMMLELFQLLEPRPSPPVAGGPARLGLSRLGLITGDVDRDHAALLDLDVPGVTTPVTVAPASSLPATRVCRFEDPDGTVLELVQPER